MKIGLTRIGLAPLPPLRDLFLNLLKSPASLDTSIWTKGLTDPLVAILKRSSCSLALVAEWWRQTHLSDGNPPTPCIWIPDYFCNASLTPLRRLGVKLVFYPVTAKREPDFTACKKLAAFDKPDLFLLVHYFGMPAPSAMAYNFCAQTKSILVEDGAHLLRPIGNVGRYSPFLFFSPHKHLGIPELSLLVYQPSLHASLGISPEQGRAVWDSLVAKVRKDDTIPWRWVFKRAVQKLGVNSIFSSARSSPTESQISQGEFTEVNSLEYDSSTSGSCTFAQSLLQKTLSKIPVEAFFRRSAALAWSEIFSSHLPNLKALASSDDPFYSPYNAPFEAPTSAQASASLALLSQSGISVSTWPDLPPEVLAHPEQHAEALQLRSRLIFLPVHSALSLREILRRLKFTARVNSTKAHLKWLGDDEPLWNRYFSSIDHSNLLQSFAYGRAKTEGGGRSKHGVFKIAAQRESLASPQAPLREVAIVQATTKRILGLIPVVRINRGPLFINNPTQEERSAVYSALAKLTSWYQPSILSVAPEAPLSGLDLMQLLELGFHRLKRAAWRSGWLNLQPPLAELRENLDPRWRNRLKFAENAGLSTISGSDQETLASALTAYDNFMRERGFVGVESSLIRTWWSKLPEKESCLIIESVKDDERVGGILVAIHGRAATYLIGWSNAVGRKCSANNLLLWNAITILKERGCTSFELGGLDYESTPEVAYFKSGLKSNEFELVGEFVKCL